MPNRRESSSIFPIGRIPRPLSRAASQIETFERWGLPTKPASNRALVNGCADPIAPTFLGSVKRLIGPIQQRIDAVVSAG